MKIATWNLERPTRNSGKNKTILEELAGVDADVLVLTETNSAIHPLVYAHSHSCHAFNAKGENRTTIWSKYPLGPPITTCDPLTNICVPVVIGNRTLNVYGTVIGIYGNREKSFLPDLEKQIADWEAISKLGEMCIAGDFNISWDSYYWTSAGRNKISSSLNALGITNLTADVPQNIDHIAVSKAFLEGAKYYGKPHLWNQEKKERKPRLSDHIGVCVTLGLN